jgi:hypothetical protein
MSGGFFGENRRLSSKKQQGNDYNRDEIDK